MVVAPVSNFVDPTMKKLQSVTVPVPIPANIDGAGRKMTRTQIACVTFGILNIVLAAYVIVSCFLVVGSGNMVFAEWMAPWHRWTDDDSSLPSVYEWDKEKPYKLNTLTAMIIALLGPYIMISKGFLFLGMSVALICGIVKKSASTVRAFLIYTTVVLPMCIIVNIFYLVMIWIHQVDDYELIAPHVAVLIFNIMFGLEVLLTCKAYRQLLIAAPYSSTSLNEYEYEPRNSYTHLVTN